MNRRDKNRWITGIIVFVFTIILNLFLGFICVKIGLPPLFSIAGSMVIAILAGYMPAVWVVLISHLVISYYIDDFLDYSLINILIIIVTAYYAQKGYFKKISRIFTYILLTALISAAVSTLIVAETGGVDETVLESNLIIGDVIASPLGMLVISSSLIFLTAIPVQIICLAFAFFVVRILPVDIKDILSECGWLQKPITGDELERLDKTKTRVISTKTVFIIAIISTCLTVLFFVAAIGSRLFIDHTRQEHEKIAVGVSEMVASMVNGDRIDQYIASGGQGKEYDKILSEMESIREISNDIEYVYVYKIMPDGCHVVFDLDTENVVAAEVGEIVPFDTSFEQYVPTLLAGGEIEPFVSDETYGWLLTSYTPVYNSQGETVCYAGCDISMEYLSRYTRQFFIRLLIMCIGMIIVIIFTGLWIAKFRIIYPVKSMVERSRFFTYDSEEARRTNVQLLEDLEICTGDEIERLYRSFLKVTKDSMNSFSTMQQKTDYIEKVQTNLIVILADMVENRDESTGDHIKKTSMYTHIIMRQMRKNGMHSNVLTDEFIDNVYKSAPLHDIGKIRITDAILNKPGKFTPEEFEIMKLHSSYGGEIITRLIESLPQASYLETARDIALYHHEKWDGNGYPEGLKGEEIPLSARIMAVADVFDALISDRVYKKAFTFEKAVDIIQEESGTHFDPGVVKAFIDAIDEVRETAKLQKR